MPSFCDRIMGAALGLIGSMLAFACSASHSPAPNGQTHWLKACTDDDGCGGLSCICGVCNAACANADACAAAVGQAGACRPAMLASAGTCSDKSESKRVCVAECSRNADCEARNPHMMCTSGICSLRVGTADSGTAMEAATTECGSPKQLSATMSTITTPDTLPDNPTLVASASGTDLLALWTDGGEMVNDMHIPEAIWAVRLSPGASGADVGVPIQLATDGHDAVAAATADGFAVVWADDAGLQLERLDRAVSASVMPSLLLDARDAQALPIALLDSDDGLVVAWYEAGSKNEVLARIDAQDHVTSKLVFEQLPDAVSPDMALAVLDGSIYFAHVRWTGDNADSVISAVDWFEGLKEQSVTPGFFGSFFATADRLVLSTSDSDRMTLYAAAHGEQAREWLREPRGSVAAADACGRVVALGSELAGPGGAAGGFFAQPLDPAAPKVDLGSMSREAFAAGATQFGVLWYARLGGQTSGAPGTGTLNFATLSWR